MAYNVCNTVKMKETGVGGRLFTAVHTADLPNGVFGFLGGYKTAEREIREFVVPTAELIIAEAPVLVMKPEIIYDQSTRTSDKIGNFVNVAGVPFSVIPVSKWDEIELSADLIEGTGIAVGSILALQAGKVKLKKVDSAPTKEQASGYFKVTEIRKSHTPVFVGSNGSLIPQAYNLYNVEWIQL